MRLLSLFALVGVGMVNACSGEDPGASSGGSTGTTAPPPDPGCKVSTECASTPDTPLCDAPSGDCVALPPASEIGVGDGSAGSVALVTVYEPDKQREPTDLAFHPDRPNELWVVNRKDDFTLIITNPGAPDASVLRKHDPDAMHFMHRPPALAFGAANTFGVCGDNNDSGGYFMGPALFSADLKVFAKGTPGGLGSHLDMLHSTSFCRGIAHVEANIYWVFNANKKSLDKYDFHEDHGPGNDDHSDGEIYRYAVGKVAGVTDIPSHVFYDADDKLLYIADTGHSRVLTLDTASGTVGKSFSGLEPVKARRYVDDASMAEIVPAGTLEAPSGLEVHAGLVFVSDNATSKFHAFEKGGKLVRTLDTGLPPGSLAGFTFGPDGKIYFVDLVTSQIHRIDPLL